MKRHFVLLFSLITLSLAAGSPLKNPALNKVTIDPVPKGSALQLLRDGKGSIAIVAEKESGKVMNTRRSVAKSCDLLQQVFLQCTGLKVPIVSPDNKAELAKYKHWIVLGNNRITKEYKVDPFKLPVEGFYVRTFPKGVIIAGHDGSAIPGTYKKYDWYRYRINGTLHGAYDFAERFFGVRWFYPGDGTIFPKLKDLTISPMAYHDSPWFINRFSHSIAGAHPLKECGTVKQRADWEGVYRMSLGSRYWAGHGGLLTKRYPDKRDIIYYTDPTGHRWNYYDFSNLKLVDLSIADMREYYKKYHAGTLPMKRAICQRNYEYIVIGQADVLVQNMDTPSIRKEKLIPASRVNSITGELSDVYARFFIEYAKQLKKYLPGKRLSLIPYHNYLLPPVKPEYRKFPDNIDLRLCIYEFPSAVPNKQVMKQWKDVMKEWQKVLGGRPISSLWLYNSHSDVFQRAIIGRYTADLPILLGDTLGRTELFFDYFGNHDWEFFYNHYLIWRGMWNPRFNRDAALDEMWKMLYGKAAPYVKEFYELARERHEKYVAQKKRISESFPEKVLTRFETLIKQAKKAVPANSPEARRLKMFFKPWPGAIRQKRTALNFTRPVYKANQLGAKDQIKIDGFANEPIWKKVPVITFNNARGGANPKGGVPVTGKLLWSKDGIYGLLDIKVAPLDSNKKDLWQNDTVELLFSPGLKQNEFFQFALDPNVQLFAAHQTLKPVPTPFDPRRKIRGSKFAVQKKKDHWTVEFKIAWIDLGGKQAKMYHTWLANFVYTNKKGGYYSYSMTFGRNQNTNQFGYIKFIEEND